MLEVREIMCEKYKDLLRSKWHLYSKMLNEKLWNNAKRCLINQAKYIDDGKMSVVSFIDKGKHYIFLEINPDKFASNDDKKQFIKETRFLRLIDFQLLKENPLDLESHLSKESQNPNSNDQIFLTQVFIAK